MQYTREGEGPDLWINVDYVLFKARVGVFYQIQRLILYEFIGEVIFKINFLWTEKIKAKVYVN
jgi:hypothetical protein